MVGKVTPYDLLSGSLLPAYMGYSQFKSPNECLKDAFDWISGITLDNFTQNEAMKWGDTLEPVVAQQASVRLGLGNPRTKYEKAIFHEEWPLAVSLDATLDGDGREVHLDWDKGIIPVNQDSVKLEGRGCLEIKITGQDAESAPPMYRGVLQLQAQIKNAAYDFKERVEKYRLNQETDWLPMSSTREATIIYDEAEDDVIQLPELSGVVSEVVELKDKIKESHDRIEILQATIMEAMKEIKTAIAGEYKVTWPMLNYKGQPEKIVPAKEAYSIRQSKLRIKQL
jgi:predicted phage-related endonuclease